VNRQEVVVPMVAVGKKRERKKRRRGLIILHLIKKWHASSSTKEGAMIFVGTAI